MSLITLQAVGFDYGRQTILEGENLTLHSGERYGLVGVNGAGKSTLLRLLAGELEPARGRIQRGSRVSIGLLPQDTELESSEGLRAAVRGAAFSELLRIESRLGELTERMGAGDDDPALLEEYGRLHESFESADGYTMESRSEAALLGLGFDLDRLDQPVNTLSGGQKRRAALAAILLAPHDVLLLDEPTNHLDLEAREWLEAYLCDRKGAMIAISHDRTFLDHATDFTLHLVNARLNRYRGGYTKFHRQWEEHKAQWEDRYRRQQDHIAKTEAFIRKNIAGQRTGQAKSRRKQLSRLERIEAPPSEGRQYRFDITPARKSGSVVFEGSGLARRFGDLELFAGLDFQILQGDKVGILGPNGTGKTTLLRLLMRDLDPDTGRLVIGTNVDLGYYDQELRLVSDVNTPLEEIRQLQATASDGDLRSLLGAFGFDSDMVDQRVGTLSGGERARLSLLRLILERHNTLLLDEPTNHLDTDTREALESALADYGGTLVVISHDRYFLNRICNRIFAFEGAAHGGRTRIRQVLGGYDDYRQLLLRDRETKTANSGTAAVEASPPPGAPVPASAGERGARRPRAKRDLSKNELAKIRREVSDLEEEIALMEADLESLTAEMSGGTRAAEDMGDLARRTQKLQSALEKGLRRWEELTLLLERDPGRGPP
jgi:ATP-binding cassette subfamily F protein 3